jgi:hypothetical protein
MNAIAPQLSSEDIANVTAHFAAQTGAAAGAKSALLPNIVNTHMALLADFKTDYIRDLTENSPEAKQVSLLLRQQHRGGRRRRRQAAAGRVGTIYISRSISPNSRPTRNR